MKLPKQLEGQSIAMLADPEIQHSPYYLKLWGLALFSIKELNKFDQLFDAEAITPIHTLTPMPYRLKCVMNYPEFLQISIRLASEIKPKNEAVFLTNLAKAFAVAPLSIESSFLDRAKYAALPSSQTAISKAEAKRQRKAAALQRQQGVA